MSVTQAVFAMAVGFLFTVIFVSITVDKSGRIDGWTRYLWPSLVFCCGMFSVYMLSSLLIHLSGVRTEVFG